MTQNNKFYDLPKTATVSYYDVETDQNLTAEEWKKLYPIANSSEIKSSDNYMSEKAFNENMAMYGSGFWEGVWTVTKKVGGFALAVTYVTPIGPLAMGATLAAVGSVELMERCGNEDVKKAAREIKGEMADVLTVTMDCDRLGEGVGQSINNYKGYRV